MKNNPTGFNSKYPDYILDLVADSFFNLTRYSNPVSISLIHKHIAAKIKKVNDEYGFNLPAPSYSSINRWYKKFFSNKIPICSKNRFANLPCRPVNIVPKTKKERGLGMLNERFRKQKPAFYIDEYQFIHHKLSDDQMECFYTSTLQIFSSPPLIKDL